MEIERKFLLKELPKDFNNLKKNYIEQSYISFLPTIRIRRYGEEYVLTVKGKGTIAREEFEMNITQAEYLELLKKVEGKTVKKTRYYKPLGENLVAEIDEYHGFLEGILTVEVEFETLESAEKFVPPDWFGEDVSENIKFKNFYFAKIGLETELLD